MPKIVNREAYRQELTLKAVGIFEEHGFNGLGMRAIAEALGVSKSALYHYFPSKEKLFIACTELVLARQSLYGLETESEIPADNEQALILLITSLDSRFSGEMTLMLDYIKNKDSQAVAADHSMQLADSKFLHELGHIVGESNAEQAYALLYGGLAMRLFNGKQTSLDQIASWILNLSK
ncbi:MAG: AcrR family transcriptional regulator [Oleiphilaceae bacterium]|jgi:AcrR family transcriptional regulator